MVDDGMMDGAAKEAAANVVGDARDAGAAQGAQGAQGARGANDTEGTRLDCLTAAGYPPARRIVHRREAHGDVFTDPYEWMREKTSPDVTSYVAAQNALFGERMKPHAAFAATLLDELRGRVHETDMSVPVRIHGYWYFGRTHKGQEYGVTCRTPVLDAQDWNPPTVDPESPLPGEEIVFDSNKEAEGHDFFRLGVMDLSRDGRWLLYGTDTHGDERYDLRIRDLHTGRDLPEHIDQVAAGGLITPDGKWVFYTKVDDAWRPYSVWRHRVGTPASEDREAWHEDDERFWVGVGMSFDETRLVIEADSKTTTEVLLLPASDPTGEFKPFIPRTEGVEYDVSFASFEGAGEDGSDIPIALVIHNVTNPNFEIDVIDLRSHKPPYTLGEGQVVAVGSAAGCEKSSPDQRALPADTPCDDPRNPAILQGLRGLRVDGIAAYRDYVALDYRASSLTHIAIMPKAEAARAFLEGRPWPFREITANRPDLLVSIGFSGNSSYEAPTARYSFNSFTQPTELRQLNMRTGEDTLLRRRDVPHYDASAYRERRLWVRVRDGVRVPVSLVWKAGLVPALDAAGGLGLVDTVIDAPDVASMIAANRAARDGARDGNAGAADAAVDAAADAAARSADAWLSQDHLDAAPLFITGYGAYGISSDPGFSVSRPSMFDRGVVYALAHVRGGGEMGRAWYEQGRRTNKANTFTDFIDVTAALQAQGWVARSRTVACGGSAGGLLMGAIATMAPYLYAGIEADVPFVDALTSMLDPDLPLTVTEWDEWGDPLHDRRVYEYMKSYSPYENTMDAAARDAAYGTSHMPHIFITTSMNDTRVLYVEPLKWLARLQEAGAGADAIARIEIDAGHGGGSGRYHQWQEVSEENAWTLVTMGLTQ
ncbi:S9 family peptidase [Pseudoscardovia radai]|uniref:S9 family peptidase n=1 Tax=Pseudoscardovia radai TaxID=987066 RepID=UPI0039933777